MLVDDELIYVYYDYVILEGIYMGVVFECWYCDEVKKGG